MATDDEASSVSEGQTSQDEEEVVESLIAGRAKRSTAGQHMSTLLNAEADDELALLFAEDEDDNEFDEDEDAVVGEDVDDMRLDSSSEDEDDQGPNTGAEELEGEQELEKQARAERLVRKRKAHESLRLTALRKKVKISPTAVSESSTPAPRPKKKSERISWLPTPDEGPIRSSSRRQTMQNKELTHARLKDSEQRRIRLIATMELAAKRKEKSKPRLMTQADRLAEAEKIERLNSKSLNRWEEMEKRKADERKARLEALQNRRLEGPVMSWWSGIAKWVNGKLTRVGKIEVKPKPDKEETDRKKRGKDQEAQNGEKTEETTAKDGAENQAADGQKPTSVNPTEHNPVQDEAQKGADAVEKAPEGSTAEVQNAPKELISDPVSFLDGIHLYASGDGEKSASEPPLSEKPEPKSVDEPVVIPKDPVSELGEVFNKPEEPQSQTPKPSASKDSDSGKHEAISQSNLNLPALISTEGPKLPGFEIRVPRLEEPIPTPPNVTKETPIDTSSLAIDPSTTEVPTDSPVVATPVPKPTQPMDIDQQTTAETGDKQPTPNITLESEPALPPAPPPVPEVVEQTGRSLLILENFDDKTAQSREYSIYFNSKKPPRLTKISSHLCPITSLPSRYRDPDTGLPFANTLAYSEFRNVIDQKYVWSTMLGCYVGASVPAKGVPEQFITGIKTEKPQEKEKEDIATKPAEEEPVPRKENEKLTEVEPATATNGEPMEVDT